MIGKLVKYGIVGLISTAIHVCVAYLFLTYAVDSLLWSNIFGFLFAYVFSYIAQSKYVFSKDLSTDRALDYFVVQLASLLLSIALTALLSDYSNYLRVLVVIIMLPFITFSIHKLWTFSENTTDNRSIIVFSAILGGLVFILVCGTKVLDPSYISWLMSKDSAQHFIGWHLFRRDSWGLPLGATQNLLYPEGTSLVFTDSIPLLAIPFKLFTQFLPDPFQYKGMWLLLCFSMQGLFAALLLKQVTENKLLIILGALFFMMIPVIYWRTLRHEALVAHWLILAGLYLYFYGSEKKSLFAWPLLLAIAALVHFYLLLMVFSLLCAYILRKLLENYHNHLRHVFIVLLSSMAVIGIIMWLAGYFVIETRDGLAVGFGQYSMNLLDPILPSVKALYFLPTLRLAFTFQYEGFNYLGLGILLLIFASLIVLVLHRPAFNRSVHLPLIVVSILLTMLAVTNTVTFYDQILFKVDLPQWLEKILGIVRSSGRMFWPVTYILLFGACSVILKHVNQRVCAVLFSVLLVIQFIDLYPWVKRIQPEKFSWNSPLVSKHWPEIMKSIDHVALVPSDEHGDQYLRYAMLAAQYNATLNTGYIARKDATLRNVYAITLNQQVGNGKLDAKTLYILQDGFQQHRFLSNISIAVVDHTIIGLSDWKAIKSIHPLTIIIEKTPVTIKGVLVRYARPGYTIFIAARDDAAHSLSTQTINQFKKLNSHIDQLNNRGSFAAVIENGSLIKEEIDPDKAVSINHTLNDISIKISSAGFNHGNQSTINISGIPLSLNKRGLNLIVYQPSSHSVRRYNFDTNKTGQGIAMTQ